MAYLKKVWYKFMCDDCGFVFHADSIKDARDSGWSISRDRQKCYCDKCTPYHRHVGSAGSRSRCDDLYSLYFG